MDPVQLRAALARGDVAPVYLLAGDDDAQVEDCIAAIHAALFADTQPDLDLNLFDGQTHQVSEVVQAARLAPFVHGRRMVLVRRCDSWKAEAVQPLATYLDRPSRSCCLVLATRTVRPLGTRVTRAVQAAGHQVACAAPRGRGIAGMIRQEMRRRGLRCDDAAVACIAEVLGGDTLRARSEIEKIALSVGDAGRVTLPDVERVLADGSTVTVFNMVDCIGAGQLPAALRYLNALLDHGDAPQRIMPLIKRQVRLLAIVSHAVRGGAAPGEAGRRAGIKHENIARKICEQACGWSSAAIGRAFDELARADLRLKSFRADKRLVLEDLLFRLAALRKAD